MDIFKDFASRIKKIIEASDIKTKDGGELDLANVVVEPPRDPAHGDLASNAALVLAKPAGQKPRDIADALAARLGEDADVAAVEIAGPGFINIRLEPGFWARHLKKVIGAGSAYGKGAIETDEKVNIEYVSANPTGPMHVGHCRGAVVGDALANLLEYAGYDVGREYYINDAGVQVDVLARSAYLRYKEAIGEEIGAIPEGLYPGDYLMPVGQAIAEAHGDSLLGLEEAEWLPVVRETTISMMMAMIREDLKALNVTHDTFFSERSLVSGDRDRVAEAIEALKEQGLIYVGTLPPPKGQLPDDWEDREQTLFRSTDFGDDIDRALLKSDGSYTYFASDIAYHYDKFLRGFTTQIDVWGADHGGYVKRMQAAVKAVTGGKAALDVKLCQLVKLYRAGEPVRMSKRSGDFITLRDVVEEVGRDAVRFMMLYRKNDAPLDFDFQKVTEQSRDNPVFYVQYAHARCASVFRQAANELPGLDLTPAALEAAPLDLLTDEGEIALIAKIAEWPRLVEAAALAHEPHRVAFYLYDLASALHAQWNRGKDLPQLRFINVEDRQSSLARLALVHSVQAVIQAGLAILGASAPDEMR
ncbi:arginyl-tRNA synthetase [Rhodobium orientis]|uniref:Arginine--tRNA ligase n=1 Tax=Rhodobium orientis TaxID=34017 RepID=A0A327JQS6_9HYPH|nr:arginine--tRNA ligase [Rhodobium orientis]MBB4302176.1 arginyl-tRNA synthetase [Rhodobium orientis]MBK5948887.1 arginine--tRNA ligase [Rhodobium orientis]RAI27926.1 arginine--tRNA ligase [Rhodobium orientis]